MSCPQTWSINGGVLSPITRSKTNLLTWKQLHVYQGAEIWNRLTWMTEKKASYSKKKQPEKTLLSGMDISVFLVLNLNAIRKQEHQIVFIWKPQFESEFNTETKNISTNKQTFILSRWPSSSCTNNKCSMIFSILLHLTHGSRFYYMLIL